MGVTAVLAVSAVVAAGAAASSANQQSIANKRAKNAAAEQKRIQDEQTQALQALEQEPEKPIPTANSDDQRRARRRSIARQLGGRGRQSTILTGGQASGLGG